jgi:hypothetical protein
MRCAISVCVMLSKSAMLFVVEAERHVSGPRRVGAAGDGRLDHQLAVDAEMMSNLGGGRSATHPL